MENNKPFQLHLLFHTRDIHKSKHLAFSTRAIQMVLSLVAIGQ